MGTYSINAFHMKLNVFVTYCRVRRASKSTSDQNSDNTYKNNVPVFQIYKSPFCPF
jgi:hypothetical protein